jgi:hypothetical protein
LNKLAKGLLISGGLIVAVIVIFVIIFWVEMSPKKAEEEKVKTQAEEFLNSNYDGEYEIYDVLYDNMGNFNYFEYAAKVRDKSTGEEFLVYYNDGLQKMEDSREADKRYNKIENNVKPKVKKFIDENISKENETSVSYEPKRDVLVNIRLLENQKENQEKDYNLIIEYLKDELGYPNADVNLIYEKEIN